MSHGKHNHKLMTPRILLGKFYIIIFKEQRIVMILKIFLFIHCHAEYNVAHNFWKMCTPPVLSCFNTESSSYHYIHVEHRKSV
jgi:hypothetical protein